MKLIKLTRSDKMIRFSIEKPNDEGHLETFDVKAPEAPHPEMDRALSGVAGIVSKHMEFKSAAGIEPFGLSVSRTKHGTRSVSILYTRKLKKSEKEYRGATVLLRIDNPVDGEAGEREVDNDEAALLNAVIEEGLRYARGERLQTLLPLEEGGDSKEEPTDPLFQESPTE